MEFLVSQHHKRSVIGKLCKKCKKPICDGDMVVTRPSKHKIDKIYHKKCWEGLFI